MTSSFRQNLDQTSARAEFTQGMRAIVPMVIAAFPIALVFGALAAQKGLTPFETMLMSSVVFAGGSQFVALDLWTDPVPWVTATVTVFLVNIRHVLMSASLGAHTRRTGLARRLFAFGFLADEVWVLSERRARKKEPGFWFMTGLALPFYANWVIFTGVGAGIGTFVDGQDLWRWGLDFAFPAIFIGLVAGFCKGRRTLVVLAASGLASLVCKIFIPGAWFIIAGAVTGVGVAALLASPDEDAGQ